ncbi:MAG: Molybdopterin dehydrogenase, FAD-binding [Hyphomicrobiales bacterium]|jgi:carbon-monoxide dehydrogenase medium subunit|nr:Molybdopterin dehydrogenase, FAD-binding [Hyphomicrobiales bacterium]
MKLAPIRYAAPSTVDEAIALLASCDAKIMSGGQSLMPIMAFRLATPELIVDLKKIAGLDKITIDAEGVHLGAKVKWHDIECDARLLTAHPLLAEAIKHVAHYQIRNRGTVGGSVAHADPASEMPAIAACCDAVISIVGPKGLRKVGAADFFVGALQTVLEPDDVVVDILLPAWPAARRWGFQEFARRRGDFALAGIAAYFDVDEQGRAANAHIAVFGAADHQHRLAGAEAALNGAKPTPETIAAAARAAAAEVDPPSDIHAPADYRRALVETLTERALAHAAK